MKLRSSEKLRSIRQSIVGLFSVNSHASASASLVSALGNVLTTAKHICAWPTEAKPAPVVVKTSRMYGYRNQHRRSKI